MIAPLDLHEGRRRTHGRPEDLSEPRPQPWQFLRKIDLVQRMQGNPHARTHRATQRHTHTQGEREAGREGETREARPRTCGSDWTERADRDVRTADGAAWGGREVVGEAKPEPAPAAPDGDLGGAGKEQNGAAIALVRQHLAALSYALKKIVSVDHMNPENDGVTDLRPHEHVEGEPCDNHQNLEIERAHARNKSCESTFCFRCCFMNGL